jgi:hypothetical protein
VGGRLSAAPLARNVKGQREDQVCHVGRPLYNGIGRTRFRKFGHALAARCLMSEDGGRTLTLRPAHFASPYGDAVAHAGRGSLKSAVGRPNQIHVPDRLRV